MKQQKWKVWITIGFIAAAALLYGMGRLYQDEGFCFIGNTGRKNAESKAESGVSEEFVMKTFSDTFFSTVADEELAKTDKRSDSGESIEEISEDAGTKKSENGNKKLEEGQGEVAGRMEANEEERGRTGEEMETGGNDREKAGEHVLWVYVCGEVQSWCVCVGRVFPCGRCHRGGRRFYRAGGKSILESGTDAGRWNEDSSAFCRGSGR